MTTPTLSQAAARVDLEWVEGDAVNLTFVVSGADWSGTYTAQVRTDYGGTVKGSLVITATYSSTTTNTTVTMTMTQANSALIVAGWYVWDLEQSGGLTRLTGRVHVLPQVTN